jgi:hypothetical protein
VITLLTPNRLFLVGARGVALERATGINWNAWDAEYKQVCSSIEIAQLLKEFSKNKIIADYHYMRYMSIKCKSGSGEQAIHGSIRGRTH